MVGHERALFEIDGLPGEAENLALAKTENQNQDVGGLQRISGGAGGFDEAPGLFTSPGQDLSLALLWGSVRADQHCDRSILDELPSAALNAGRF